MPRLIVIFSFVVLSLLASLTTNSQANTNSNADVTSLSELSKKNTVKSGFIDLITDPNTGKVYLKVHNLNETFIHQTSLPNGLGSNDIGLDRGQLGNTSLVAFERAGNKLFLKQHSTRYRAVSDNSDEAASVKQAFASSVLWGFTVQDTGRDGDTDWVLVDATQFMLQDSHGVGRTLTRTKQGKGYKVDASRSAPDLAWSKTFPDNTELQATITLTGTDPGAYLRDTAPNPYAVTLAMRHSFIRLPDAAYKPRVFIPKSGYWAISYRDYAQPINQAIEQKVIPRHRLTKQDPTADMSEAVEPIVYYLDSGAPEPVRSALLDGARWWNDAFTALGYKDAFQVKILPDGADPMDVRYNVIQWVHRATRGWSYGSSVVDPRTGEIIKGHVSLGSLRVRQDYLIAQGMMSPFANSEEDQALQDLALARIRQLSAHEIGHTLGIAHNFAASNYGRESVMDYPHPLFKLSPNNPNTIIAPNAYGVGLGKWDMATIAYGYQEFGNNNEVEALRALIAQNDANGLLYISDADSRNTGSPHAHSSLWDNGSNPTDELERMITLRQVALANFGANTLKQHRPVSDLEEILVPVYLFHRYQTTATAKMLGGIDYEYSTKTEAQKITSPAVKTIDANQQNRAFNILLSTLSPAFLTINDNILALLPPKAAGHTRTRESVNGHTNVSFDITSLPASAAQHTLSVILNPERLNRLVQQNALNADIPSLLDIANTLQTKLIDQRVNGAERLLHSTVIDLVYSHYVNLTHNKTLNGAAKAQLALAINQTKLYLNTQIKKAKDPHYKGLFIAQLNKLNQDHAEPITLPSIPPGSPI